MKNPTYTQFLNEVNNFIAKLSKDQLKEVITGLAENSPASNRNNFLHIFESTISPKKHSQDTDIELSLTHDEFMEQIQDYYDRMKEGEFYDVEKDYDAYHRSERWYWDTDGYYDNEPEDYSSENYVIEVLEMLETAKCFFRKEDIDTAYEAYKKLFEIINYPDKMGHDEIFISDFSFETAIGNDIVKEHKCIYYRLFYLKIIDIGKFEDLFLTIKDESNILLTDIIEIDRKPLPKFDKFLTDYIGFLCDNPKNDKHLIDALFIKGGMNEIKRFGYKNGEKHPSAFLYYYSNAKEEGLPKDNILQLLLDGIKIIPEKYKSRSYLSLDLIDFAKKENDRKNLLLGYSTAFYSHKSLKNLAYLLDFIISEKKDKEIKKLKNYFKGIDVKELQSNRYYFTEISGCGDIFSLDSSEIEPVTLIIGQYILNGIEPILNFIDTNNYKGFSDKLRYIAATVSLALKTIAGSEKTVLIDLLLDYYCLDKSSEEYSILKNMVNNTAEESSDKENEVLLKKLKEMEKISISRVSYILDNKYRKGYERGCLLLTACAEALQIISSDGDVLISKIDTEFKRYSAFRSYLKKYTAKSSLLKSV